MCSNKLSSTMKLKVLILLVAPLLCLSWIRSPESYADEYIEAYKDLAVIEMHRTGVPASITLAQGLHESNFGTSKLATEANNHFGIKCKSYWQGGTYYYKDDDLDKKGKLIESCFRSYDSALESYVDHSNFLTRSAHYSELFQLNVLDYKSWAYGLKRCGYATDPNYAEKLIRKIEKYNLSIYDLAECPLKNFAN